MSEEKNTIQEETATAPTPDKAEEYLNNWKRERAEFQNYKKDEIKRIEQFAKFASEDVILETIEIVDDLELAVQELKNRGPRPVRSPARDQIASPEDLGEATSNGMEQIIRKFKDLFKKYGVEEIVVDGKKFDPAMQEAVETEPGGEKIVQVRSGYMMHDKVLRPARVKITK